MFYVQELLTRKGAWGVIWLAATYNHKVTKRIVLKVDLLELVKQLTNPTIPLSLRLSAILMIGVMNLFNKKSRYLLSDTNEVWGSVKSSLAKLAVDSVNLAESTAKLESITLSVTNNLSLLQKDAIDLENIDLQALAIGYDDLPAEYFNVETALQQQQSNTDDGSVALYQARHRDITLQDQSSLNMDFGNNDLLEEQLPATDLPNPDFELSPIVPMQDDLEMAPFVPASESALLKELSNKRKRREKGFLRNKRLKIDASTEVASSTMKEGLADRGAIIVDRPLPPQSNITNKEILDRLTMPSLPFGNTLCAKWQQVALSVNKAHELNDDKLQNKTNTSAVDKARGDAEFLGEFDLPNMQEFPTPSLEFARNQSTNTQSIATPGMSPQPFGTPMESTPWKLTPGQFASPQPKANISSIKAPRYATGLSDLASPSLVPASPNITQNTYKMLQYLRRSMGDESSSCTFTEINSTFRKRTAARSFYQLLVLNSDNAISCAQTTPYGEITISKSANFDEF